jgi:hypothetical protein
MKTIRIRYKFHKNFTWFEALPYRSFEPFKYSPDIVFFPNSEPVVEVGLDTFAFFKKSDFKLIIRAKGRDFHQVVI